MLKETIYTIPINDAFKSKCACPLCELQAKLDDQAVEHTLGASMMEPHFRIITNEKGFCKYHFSRLTVQKKSLPLALIMQSQSDTQNKAFKNGAKQAKKLFKKQSKKEEAMELVKAVNLFLSSCAICNKIASTMDKMLKNTVYLWKTQKEFKEIFQKSTFCLPHFAQLVECAANQLSNGYFEAFYNELKCSQINTLDKIYSDISYYTKLYDHRSGTQAPPEIKTALKRCIHIYSGYQSTD